MREGLVVAERAGRPSGAHHGCGRGRAASRSARARPGGTGYGLLAEPDRRTGPCQRTLHRFQARQPCSGVSGGRGSWGALGEGGDMVVCMYGPLCPLFLLHAPGMGELGFIPLEW